MKKRAACTLLKGETFPYDVVVALGTTKEELLAYMHKNFFNALSLKDHEALQFNSHGRTIELDNNAYILWVRDFPRTPDQYAHLAHEIFHTADLMLRKAGVSLSNDSDEIWAYHIGWLTKNIYSRFKLA